VAVSYTNIIKTNVLDSVEKLLEDEFGGIPVGYEAKGNECFVLEPQEDTLIELLSGGQARSYAVLIVYQMKKAGNMELNKDHLTGRAERVKRLIYNNSAYSPSSTYKFHDGRTESIVYEIDEDDPELKRANITFTCIVTEAI
jgi:hypothetical protein|tara:strand:- start:272 stop:697 length:426 start_codon:yes stop_codon:yes gene_type:complete